MSDGDLLCGMNERGYSAEDISIEARLGSGVAERPRREVVATLRGVDSIDSRSRRLRRHGHRERSNAVDPRKTGIQTRAQGVEFRGRCRAALLVHPE